MSQTPENPPAVSGSGLHSYNCSNCGRFVEFKACLSNANGNWGRLVATCHRSLGIPRFQIPSNLRWWRRLQILSYPLSQESDSFPVGSKHVYRFPCMLRNDSASHLPNFFVHGGLSRTTRLNVKLRCSALSTHPVKTSVNRSHDGVACMTGCSSRLAH
ncbi:hypothetical protein K443DRAFT_313428 [Laccaria amethystina LaAM-08-1]|uniref:Uncharacterized protein n=1 Tax=Laccaria amethystina LaAM-08-1 TaxID=1095629 RepID=A0A0C9XE05_9AGAR|nr:hypothetical protein K443DRAFT_313428 [Laccaria amethystina LaAM-08-1]